MDELEQKKLFEQLFSPKALFSLYKEKYSNSAAKGIDRINGVQFSLRAKDELKKASEKCSNGTFRFTPYLEKLKSKGRGKTPRVISIPTIRDRVILKQLNFFLCQVFPECVPKSIASIYIRRVAEELQTASTDAVYVCSCDIEGFYDNIIKNRLINILSSKIKNKNVLDLITRSLITPTANSDATKSQRKKYSDREKGVPQGLSISNILASIYMFDVDAGLHKLNVSYYRYVDDVLMYGNRDDVITSYHSIRRRLKYRGLNIHPISSPKTHLGFLNESFGFLGYLFKENSISVRESTVDSFLKSIAARFSDYIHNKSKRLSRYEHLTHEDLKEIFLEELNDKLTGAISDNKRYGWVAYYSHINDLSLLHKIDFIIGEMFKRLSDFECIAPPGLKKISRAYYEIKYSPYRGYVRNYDNIQTLKQKREFLFRRGRIAADETLTKAQIEERYDRYKAKILANMLADEGELYPK